MADKRVKQLVRELGRQGWRVELGKGGHYRAQSPDGETTVFFGSTPSDHRWYDNTVSKLKKGGYKP